VADSGVDARRRRPPGALALAVLALAGSHTVIARNFVTVARGDSQTRPSDPAEVSVSDDGRYVAFTSYVRLAPNDGNDLPDVYVLDRTTGTVSLETPDVSMLVRSSAAVWGPRVSANGRFLTYETVDLSRETPLHLVMFRDRTAALTRVVQRSGIRPDGGSRGACVSADGALVAFSSSASNLVDGPDANGTGDDVYALETASMTFKRISLDSAGVQSPQGASFSPAISADGRYVAFTSTAPLDGTSRAGERAVNVYVRDTRLGRTTRVSVAADGGPPNGPSYGAAISGDGRYVAFVSEATNLVRQRDRNRARDVFVRDTVTRVTELVSRSASGGPANGPSSHPSISRDGRIVVFQSDASDLACAARCSDAERDINLVADIFAYDRSTGRTRRVSQGLLPWSEPSVGPSVDGSGTVIAFSTRHPIDAADDRDDYDLFVWGTDR
jgi:Tol biopolymer transport system component